MAQQIHVPRETRAIYKITTQDGQPMVHHITTVMSSFSHNNPSTVVTTSFLKKGVSENFEFPCIVMTSTMTSSEYILTVEDIFLL
jgi:hypothetical protein